MNKIETINIGRNNAESLRFNILKNYSDLIEDYKKIYKIEEIKKSFLAQRLFARFLSYRTLQPEIINPILLEISKKINKKIFLAPFCYVRYCEHNKFINNDHKKAALFTEPHYDKYDFNNSGLTFWIPLHKSDSKTGTLCYIKKNKKISRTFPVKGKNKFNIKNYVKEYKFIDPLIKEKIVAKECEFGNALYFDQNVLHGAIHSKLLNRISINLQISFAKKKKINTNKKFFMANNFLREKNIMNLIYHNDFVFVNKNKNLINQIFKEKNKPLWLINKFEEIKKRKKDIHLNLLEDIHYSKEDSWLN